MTIRLAIAGAGGRMGQALIEAALAEPDLALASALDVAGSPVLGRDAGERLGRATGVAIGSDVARALNGADVLIDFTRPEGTVAHVAACESAGVAAVVGTTGLSQEQQQRLAQSARRIPIVFAPNMSVGVNVLAEVVRLAAQRLGAGYDIEVVEMHHRHKVDAPSGTALLLGKAAAQGRGVDFDEHAVYARHGVTGARKADTIGFAALRGGDVVGDHTVVFAGPGERVELSHKAASRGNFAAGAMRAVRFVAERRARNAPGLYDMADVLGLRTS